MGGKVPARLGAAVATFVLAVAAPAGASTADVRDDGTLTYATLPGETSSATIACDAASCTISDGAAIEPGAGCTGALVGAVRCDGVTRRDVRTGAGDDSVTLRGPLPGTIDLGGGADVLRATGAAGADEVDAGPGDDDLDLRDGAADDLGCGAGEDTVRADGIDLLAACEHIDVGRRVDVEDTAAPEGGVLRFTVRLRSPSALPVRVSFATRDGEATAPDDYAAREGTLTFGPLETVRTVEVPVARDALDEPGETLALVLVGSAGVAVGRDTATGTIADDDPTPGPPPSAMEPGAEQPPAEPEPPGPAAPPAAEVRANADAAPVAVAAAAPPRRCLVPRVAGLTVREATRRLVRAGCRLARVQRRSARVGGVRPGRAIRTDPRAGRSVARGALVTLLVRR